MSVFKDYAAYYDLLYKDKDYQGEANYIHKLIQRNCPGAKTLLDLGCGTGNYSFELEKLGYEVVGVDFSEEMINLANRKKEVISDSQVEFLVGDIRTQKLNKKFDVVVALFHVMSYQIRNDDLKAGIDTAVFHLNSGGVFLFDFWYGSGVLTDKPYIRHRILENEALKIHRIAEPIINYIGNYVDVNYKILVLNKAQKDFYEVNETHKMRYLFLPELRTFTNAFTTSNFYKWNTFQLLENQKCWYAIWVGKK